MSEDYFNLNLDELFAELTELTNNQAITQQAYLFLLLLWGYFEVSVVQPDEKGKSEREGLVPRSVPTMIAVEKGYTIADYGYCLKTSPGKYYGSYTTGRLLITVKAMIELLAKRGAQELQFEGLAPAKRVAWLECEKHNLKISNQSEPDLSGVQALKDRLRRIR